LKEHSASSVSLLYEYKSTNTDAIVAQMLADKAAAAEEASKQQQLLPENASTERDRLLLEFEERRKDLEAQQKQEQVAPA
jgi:hypothetical protein